MIYRKALAEFAGTSLLAMVVVGSGIMGTQLSSDLAVVLLVNAVATSLGLVVLIHVLGPTSGAHFNPVVSLVKYLQRAMPLNQLVAYMVAQVLGAVSGTVVANVMYELPAISPSGHERHGAGAFVGEIIATTGLVCLIVVLSRRQQQSFIATAVAAWIGSAYFFTSSTSFANPAITVGRAFTDTFSGIAWPSVAPFVAAQIIGAVLGLGAALLLTSEYVPLTDSPHVGTKES